MFKLKIKILNKEAKIPSYATAGDVGLDMYSLEDKIMKPGEHHIFFVGFALEFPIGYGAFVKDKSGISKAGLHTMGGVYDAGYRGEYNVHLVNLSDKDYEIKKGNKIAQLVILSVELPEIEIVDELSESKRGEGRFGSTGK
ncbi:TPA: dUTP diphosphatase [Candidatus Nomurabacteria bacterium]|nr:dUTP diphosphatase [Candidatus Nomurabacteria bacterium]